MWVLHREKYYRIGTEVLGGGMPGWATTERLEQTQLTGARNGFGASLHLEFVEDNLVVPFNRAQGEEKPRANLTIGKSLGNEVEYF